MTILRRRNCIISAVFRYLLALFENATGVWYRLQYWCGTRREWVRLFHILISRVHLHAELASGQLLDHFVYMYELRVAQCECVDARGRYTADILDCTTEFRIYLVTDRRRSNE